MASVFDLKHNKYVSTPDWFKDVDLNQSTQPSVDTSTIYVGGFGSGVATGISNITLYNKYALKLSKLNSDALSIENTAFVLKTVEGQSIGDAVHVNGWVSTDMIDVAGSTMSVTSNINDDNDLYGILFYDNRRIPISGHVLTSSQEDVEIPADASFFRISVPLYQPEFLIEYYVVTEYTKDQLEISGGDTEDYLKLNESIPEGLSVVTFNDNFKLLVQQPLSASRDANNVIKLSANKMDANDMFVWDKKLAAFGYDEETGKAFEYINGELQFTINLNGETVPKMTDNSELWMYDKNLEDRWIIKTTKQRFSLLEGLMEYDSNKNSFLFHKSMITDKLTLGQNTHGGELYFGSDDSVWIREIDNNVLTIHASDGVKILDSTTIDNNLLVTGGITMYSDINKKTNLGEVRLSLEQIANAPLIKYYYNDDKDKSLHVGSIALYWADINNWFCKKGCDGFYTMEILNLALAASISVAKDVLDYKLSLENKIDQLTNEIAQLKKEIDKLITYYDNTTSKCSFRN